MNSTDKKFKLTLKRRSMLTGLAFVSLWIVGFCVFTLYPLIYTFYLSFNNVRVTAGEGILTEYLGWENYRRAFVLDNLVAEALSEYFSEMIIYVPIIIVVALIIALMLNNKIKGTGIFRTIFFLPVIITSGPVIQNFVDQGVASLTVSEFFDTSVLYEYVPSVFADAVSFLIDSFIMILWFSGVQILIYLAGLKKLDKAMYEAARIDGAGKWETFWKLTLPALNPIIIINIVYTVVTQSLFSLNPIVVKIKAEMNNVETGYGYASALAWIYTVVIILVLGVFVLLFKRHEKKNRRLADE